MTAISFSEKGLAYRCATCGFELWSPVCQLQTGFVGLYDDARFPGRCLFVALDHFEDLGDLPTPLLTEFFVEATKVAEAIRRTTGAKRVNYAVLGNAEPHVHFHLIPRYPDREAFPNRAPWNDPRPKRFLPVEEKQRLACLLRKELNTFEQEIASANDDEA